MRTFSKLAKITLGSGALVAAIAVAPGAIAAPTTGAPDSVVERHAAATTKAEQQRVIDYWTPERMRNAVPRELAIKGQKGKPGGGGSAVKVTPQPQFGKVFFTLGGTNYVCSGTATASSNNDLVTTAGHCLNEGPGAYATNFAFVPAYDNGNRPFGTWPARMLLTTNQWKNSGDFNYDVGFAAMADLNGKSLTEVTGSYPIGFNLGYGLRFDAYGYPAASPFNGQDLYKCSGTSGRDTLGGTMDHKLACNMTGGSSGGGWITSGKLNSVNSFKYSIDKNSMYGPYFGNTVQTTYNSAQTS